MWESNHVWLIIALVLLWTGFPVAFARIFTTLFVPLSVAALGIVLRGAGFAFRSQVQTLRWQRVSGAIFALASLLTPFFLGTVIGAIVTGRVRGAAWRSGGVLGEPDVPADRRPVRGHLRVPGRRLPGHRQRARR